MSTLNLEKIEANDQDYYNNLLKSFIKTFFGSKVKKDANYYYNNEFDSNQSLFEALMNDRIISIKANNSKEFRILNIALRILIDLNPGIIVMYVEFFQENKPIEKSYLKNPITNELFNKYFQLLPEKNQEQIEQYTELKFSEIEIESLSIYQQTTIDNIFQTYLNEDDLGNFIKERIINEDEEEEEEEEAPILIDEFFNYIMYSADDFEVFDKLQKSKEKHFVYRGKKNIKINSEYAMFFDKNDILKLLDIKLNDKNTSKRLEQIFSVKDE